MATDERNFRSSYYGKVGLSVEEKKSLNKLLQDNIRNHAKLKQFCLSYTVPTTQRSMLWQLILHIIPLHKESTEFVFQQRKEVFDDLARAVRCISGIFDGSSSKHNVIFHMWLLENNRLLHRNYGDSENDNNFVAVVQVLLQIFENDVETYWVAKEFFGNCIKEIQRECPKLKELTQKLLKQEDNSLYSHLEKLGAFSSKDCVEKWYSTGFAGMIGEIALVKVWDKICGGSTKIVIFVLLELVKTLRQRIMQCNSINELKSTIEKVKEQDATIVNKAMKAWQNNKNHSEITVH